MIIQKSLGTYSEGFCYLIIFDHFKYRISYITIEVAIGYLKITTILQNKRKNNVMLTLKFVSLYDSLCIGEGKICM